MPRRTITDAQRERIYEMREAGKTHAQISRATGVSVSGISWLCIKAGVEHPSKPPRRMPPGRPAFSRGGRVVRPFTAAEDALIERMRAAGHTYSAIGAALTPPRGWCAGSRDRRLRGRPRRARNHRPDRRRPRYGPRSGR